MNQREPYDHALEQKLAGAAQPDADELMKLNRQLQAEDMLRRQQEAIRKVQASRAALLYSPLGLRSLFPTNLTTVRIKKKVKKGQPPQTELDEAAMAQAQS